MEFPDILALYNSLYTKQPINFIPEHSMQTNIMFTKWLMREPELVPVIYPLIDYLYFLESKHFYYLLYTHVPKRQEAPRIRKKGTKVTKNEHKVVTKMREIFGWSQIELEKSLDVVEKTIIKNKAHWEREFGFRL